MGRRPAHPNKHIEAALRYAESRGWDCEMPTLMKRTYSFTLILAGANPHEESNLDRLFERGCDDATFGERDGVYTATFDREATSFARAIASAMNAVENAVVGLRVARIEPEDLVTASDIATRIGRSRESVRLFFEGRRGEGDFPSPIAWLGNRTRLWSWAEVLPWLERHVDARALRTWKDYDPNTIAHFNMFLEIRDRLLERSVDKRYNDMLAVFEAFLHGRGGKADGTNAFELLADIIERQGCAVG